MTITEMIKTFDKLSTDEQDNLLEILHQHRGKTKEKEVFANESQIITESTENDDIQQETFWEMTLRFRQRMEAEGIEFTDDDFADLRDKSVGREVEL